MIRIDQMFACAWRVPLLLPVGVVAIGVSVAALPLTGPIAFIAWRVEKRFLDAVDAPSDADELARCIAFCYALAAMLCMFLPLFGIAIAGKCWDRTIAPLRTATS